MSERGVIKNKKYFNQPLIFEGLRWNTITPTDIDACIDFKNKVFIFIEVKYGNIDLNVGQKILIERLVNNIAKPSYGIVCRHMQKNDIFLKSCIVSDVYNGKWHSYKGKGISVEDAITKIRKKHNL